MFHGLLLVVALAQTLATPLPPQPADGLIAGRVIDGATGQPIPGVTVTLALRAAPNTPPPPRESTPPPPRVLVDGGGRFVFAGLKPGTYDLTATRRGFVNGEFGKLRPDGPRPALVVGPSERRTSVVIRVWKYASIAGVVLDEMNEPVVGVIVYALRREWVAGEMRFATTGSGGATDDRGMYRIGSLLAGEYLISVPSTQRTMPAAALDAYGAGASAPPNVREAIGRVAAQPQPAGSRDNQRIGELVLHGNAWSVVPPEPSADGRMSVYATAFYPHPPGSSSSQMIAIAAGEARSIPAIHLRPTTTVRVSGTLTNPDGPAPFTPLSLIPQNVDDLSSEYGFEAAYTMTDATGAFTFLGVTSGAYRLRAATAISPAPPPGLAAPGYMPSTAPTYWLTDTVTVAARDVALTLALKPGLRITGRVLFEGQKAQPPASQIARDVMTFAAADGRQINRLNTRYVGAADGSFTIHDVSGGRIILTTFAVPSGWFLKSMTLNGQDVIDTPVDVTDDLSGVVVTFTDRSTSIKGTVRTNTASTGSGQAGAGDAEALVIVFPANPQRWLGSARTPARIRTARPDAGGTYSIGSLPPGDYLIAAIHDAAATNWQSPKFLEGLSRQAIRLRIDEGATLLQDLKRVEVK